LLLPPANPSPHPAPSRWIGKSLQDDHYQNFSVALIGN